MLPRMERLTLDTLRTIARRHGFEWSDAELGALRPDAEASLALLETLRALPLGAADPTTQYRMF
jgi:hypothetical protein